MASGFSFTAQQKEKLNDTALRYYIAVQSGNKVEQKRTGNEIMCFIYDYANRHKYDGSVFCDEEFCQKIAEIVWAELLKKWCENGGEGDFANYMSKTIRLRYTDHCKEEGKKGNALSLDASFDDKDGSDSAGSLYDTTPGKEETSSAALEFSQKVNTIAYGIMANKKKMQNSPKYDYMPLYYTEFMSLLRYYGLTYYDFEHTDSNVWGTLEKAFLDSYCVMKCACWKDLFMTDYKRLSEVTGRQEDKNESCVTVSKADLSSSKNKSGNYTKRAANVKAAVFLDYISKTAKSGTYVKNETDISNTRTKKFLPFIDAVLKYE